MHGPAAPASPLTSLGLTGRWTALLAEHGDDVEAARVVRDDRGAVLVRTETDERRADVPRGVVVCTGDWVAIRGDELVAVLDRATAVMRPRSDGSGEQVLAANVDLVGVVHAIDAPLRRRRLERGVVLAWESGATPVVLLTKADVCDDVEAAVAEAQLYAPG